MQINNQMMPKVKKNGPGRSAPCSAMNTRNRMHLCQVNIEMASMYDSERIREGGVRTSV